MHRQGGGPGGEEGVRREPGARSLPGVRRETTTGSPGRGARPRPIPSGGRGDARCPVPVPWRGGGRASPALLLSCPVPPLYHHDPKGHGEAASTPLGWDPVPYPWGGGTPKAASAPLPQLQGLCPPPQKKKKWGAQSPDGAASPQLLPGREVAAWGGEKSPPKPCGPQRWSPAPSRSSAAPSHARPAGNGIFLGWFPRFLGRGT